MKIGDKVIMSELGEDSYIDSPFNPHNTLGVIDDAGDDGEFYLRVTWSNGRSDFYSRDELELI